MRFFIIVMMPAMMDEQQLIKEMAMITFQNIPLHFLGFGWGENVVLAYLALPVVRILHADALLTLRFVALMSNLVTLFITYALAKVLFNKRVAFLAVVIGLLMPWSVISGSIAFNVFIALTFLYAGALLLISNRFGPKSTYVAAAFFAIACYAYAASFFWIAVLLVGVLLYRGRKEFYRNKIGPLALFVLLVIPILFIHVRPMLPLQNISRISVFSFPVLTDSRIYYLASANQADEISPASRYLINYASHFNFVYLSASIINGVVINPYRFLADPVFYHHTARYGIVYNNLGSLFDVFLIVAGLYYLLRSTEARSARRFIFVVLLLYPLGSSFYPSDYIGFTTTRDIVVLPVFLIIEAYAFVMICKHLRSDVLAIYKSK